MEKLNIDKLIGLNWKRNKIHTSQYIAIDSDYEIHISPDCAYISKQIIYCLWFINGDTRMDLTTREYPEIKELYDKIQNIQNIEYMTYKPMRSHILQMTNYINEYIIKD